MGLSIWIKSNGNALPEYKTEVDDETSVSCYIPSVDGEQFQICWENNTDIQDSSITDKLHPTFASPEGDVILSARGGQTFFRVHSYTLKTTSGFFREMYSLPQYVLFYSIQNAGR